MDHESAIVAKMWRWILIVKVSGIKSKASHHHFSVVSWRCRGITVVAKVEVHVRVVRYWQAGSERPGHHRLKKRSLNSRHGKVGLIWMPLHRKLQRARWNIEVVEVRWDEGRLDTKFRIRIRSHPALRKANRQLSVVTIRRVLKEGVCTEHDCWLEMARIENVHGIVSVAEGTNTSDLRAYPSVRVPDETQMQGTGVVNEDIVGTVFVGL